MNGLMQAHIPYPIDAQPSLLGDMSNEVAAHMKVAVESAAAIASVVATIAVQDKIMVLHPHGQTTNVAKNAILKGESGGRTSPVFDLIAKPLFEHDEAIELSHENALAQHEAKISSWLATHHGLLAKLEAAAKKGDPTEDFVREVEAHAACKPIKPRNRRIVYRDFSKRSLMEAVQGTGRSIAIVSDEGGGVLNSDPLEEMSLLNSLWGGSTVAFDRANGSAIVARESRVSTLLGVQGAIWDDHIGKHGDTMRASGYLGRYQFTAPVSMVGYRSVDSVKPPTWPCLDKFHERARELFAETVRRDELGETESKLLELDADAKVCWMQRSNEIEMAMQPGGWLHEIKDFGSKTIEKAVRDAAVLHHFTGQEGLISADTFERAYAINFYHLQVAHLLFAEMPMVTKLNDSCHKLVRYLHRMYTLGFQQMNRADVYRNGPLRDRSHFGMAIDHLCHQGVITVVQAKGKALIILLNAQYFSGLPRC